MSNRITHCIACDSDRIAKKRGLFSVTVHGQIVKIPAIESYTCATCGETFLDLDNEAKIDAYLERHRTQPAATGS